MRYVKTVLIAAVILLACIVPAAAAQANSQVQFEILTDEQLQDLSRAAPINGDIRQGETDRHTYTPVTGQKLEISLTWNRQSSGNDLDLCICPPGTDPTWIQDEIDGKSDGKISVGIPLTTSTINNLWVFNVVGAHVSGTQSYTLTINSY